MRKLIISFILGILISNISAFYPTMRANKWFKTHRLTQGMPVTLDIKIALWISRPINEIVELMRDK